LQTFKWINGFAEAADDTHERLSHRGARRQHLNLLLRSLIRLRKMEVVVVSRRNSEVHNVSLKLKHHKCSHVSKVLKKIVLALMLLCTVARECFGYHTLMNKSYIRGRR
jgi:hypothetical protein